MKHTSKQIIVIIWLSIFIMAILLNHPVNATENIIDENTNTTETQNTQTEEISEEDNNKRYTIEDIVFNRIPIFDVNVFSDTAGGEPVVEGSITYVIRTIVATWYISVRNAIIVVIAILLIYSGIRMSIATVASDKANYKMFFIGWLKSFIILFTIHFIMSFILNINGMLVNMFDNVNSNEYQMYDTIRTRAYDLRFSVGLAGMIMYIFIIFMFAKFAWMYIKRLFTTLILIILAPLIAGKYAFESASGKNSKAFSNWLYQFTSNVLIQSVHALLYTSIVGIALNISLNNITSFIIALVFLNFMLSADKIVLKLFKFNDNLDEMHKPFKKEEQLTGFFYAYGAVKVAKTAATRGARFVGNVGANALEAVTGKDYARKFKDNVNQKLDSIDNYLIEKIDTSQNGETSTKQKGKTKSATLKQKVKDSMKNYLILKISSREKGANGIKARQALRLRKAKKHEVYKSNFKFILGEVQGVGSLIIGVPVMVFNPTAGIGVIASGVNSLKNNRKQENLRKWTVPGKVANTLTLGAFGNRLEAKEKAQKSNKEIENLVNAVNKTHEIRELINKEYKKIPNIEERAKAREAMKKVNALRNETSNIRRYMQNYMKVNQFNSLEDMDDKQKKKMVIDISTKTGAKDIMSRDEIEKIGTFVVDTVTGKRGNNKYTDLNIDNMSSIISESLTKGSIKSKFVTLGIQINNLKDSDKDIIEAAYVATEEDDNELMDINRFIDNLEY